MDAQTTARAEAQEFSGSIEIPYDTRFTGPALDWAAGLAGLAGGARNESDALRLALEETLNYLIGAYPDAEDWERLRVELQLQAGGLVEISVVNAGPPMHLNRIPQYSPQAPSEANIDGLWYFLAREVLDDLSFLNRGKDGWLAILRKRLAAPSFARKNPGGGAVAPGRKVAFSTRLAVPLDAGDLVSLIYDTYRYSYPQEAFYHEPNLRAALERQEIISVLVEADGVTVGQLAFSFPRETPRCGYLGTLMIKPAFRQSRAILHLLKATDDYLAGSSDRVDLSYSTLVTAHTGSQKAGARSGFFPLALYLSAVAAVDFRGMRVASEDRESFCIAVRLAVPWQQPLLYLPEPRQAVMAGLLEQAGIRCALSEEEAAPQAARSAFSLEEDALNHCAYLTVTRVGRDFSARLHRRLFSLRIAGFRTVIILVPAWLPPPPGLDQEMGRMNAVFSGIKPVSAREAYLVYCALAGPVDFERIRLVDPLAQNLKEHCRQLYEEMREEPAPGA